MAPSTTPGGLPYPLPTDPLAAGADAIKNLATAVEAKAMQQFVSYTPVWSGDSGTPNLGTGGALNGLYRLQGAKVITIALRLYLGAGNVQPTGGWRFSIPLPASAALPFTMSGVVDIPSVGRWPCAGWVHTAYDANAITTIVDGRGNHMVGGYGPTNPGTWLLLGGTYLAA